MRIDDRPRFRLSLGPTPLEAAPRLGAELGVELWIKRDDLTGLAMGGNKTRKLEYLVGDALERGADTLITAGAAQSNHCRQSAAAAAKAQLTCHLALGGQPPAKSEGNLLIDEILGAHLHWCGPHRKGETIEPIADELRAAGARPYVIPYGGSNPIGALGFVAAMEEFSIQCHNTGVEFDRIIFASSSGGTHAGMIAGADRSRIGATLTGIRIDKDPGAALDLRDEIASIATELMDDAASMPPIDLVESFHGPGYAVVTDLERDALLRLARTEGVLLDPVYTARAFGGMLAMIEDGRIRRGERIAFWHTGGGPALFVDHDSRIGS